MSDVVTPPTSPEPAEEMSFTQQAQAWIHSNESFAAPREKGVEVVQRDIDGLPLSDRESAFLQWVKAERRHVLAGYDEEDRALFTDYDNYEALADKVGSALNNPNSTSGHMAVLARLSDVRPPDPEPTGEAAPSDYSWAEEWLHENNDGHLAFRQAGFDALKTYRADEAARSKDTTHVDQISPQEKAVIEVNLGELKSANDQYMEQLGEPMYPAGPDTDKFVAEKVGLDLQAISAGDIRPDLQDAAALSDKRIPKQPQEGEQ